MHDKSNDPMALTSSIKTEQYFISALPTSSWRQILWYCRSQPTWHGRLSKYIFDSTTWLTIGIHPIDSTLTDNSRCLSGTYFSERFHQHTFHDIIEACREGDLDFKALTYPELLDGQDTMIVYFWPNEESLSDEQLRNDELVHRQSKDLFSELSAQAILCF